MVKYHRSGSFLHFTYFEAIPCENQEKPGGGLSPSGENQNRNQFVFLSFEVKPLNWQSFIEIGKVACSTTAGYFRGHSLNIRVSLLLLSSEDILFSRVWIKRNRLSPKSASLQAIRLSRYICSNSYESVDKEM